MPAKIDVDFLVEPIATEPCHLVELIISLSTRVESWVILY